MLPSSKGIEPAKLSHKLGYNGDTGRFLYYKVGRPPSYKLELFIGVITLVTHL